MRWFKVKQAKFNIGNGEEVVFRPLLESDVEAFGKFLEGLSKETTELFGTHPLTMLESAKLCAQVEYSNTLRMVTCNSLGEIIGYMVISYPLRESQQLRYREYGIELIQGRDLCIAPGVADRYQDKGVGSFMLKETIKIARNLKAKYIILWQGTQTTNKRAIHFYKKFGFKINAEFQRYGHANYDMTLDLQ